MTDAPEDASLAERLAAIARAIGHWHRDADRDAHAAASAGAQVHPRYQRIRGRADALAALALGVRNLAERAMLAARVGAPWVHLPLDAYQLVVRRATASAVAEDRAGAGRRAVGWHDARENVAGELRPLLAPLDRYAASVVAGRGWDGPAPEGAPVPRDRLIWAHRRCDAPLVVAHQARRGRPEYRDPRHEPLWGETLDELPPARRWDVGANMWRTAAPAPPGSRPSGGVDAALASGAEDPEAPARARALLFRQALRLEHRLLSAAEAAALLGCTEDEVQRRATVHELLALPGEGGNLLIPLDQLTGAAALPGLAQVLRAVVDVPIRSAWVTLDLLTAPIDDLGGRSVLHLLRDGERDLAIQIVATYGEQGA